MTHCCIRGGFRTLTRFSPSPSPYSESQSRFLFFTRFPPTLPIPALWYNGQTMPHSHMTASERRLFDGFRSILYLLAAVGGFGGIFLSPPPPAMYLHDVWGWLAFISGLMCLFAVVRFRWRLEWMAVWGVGCAAATYSAALWALALNSDYTQLMYVPAAAFATCGALYFVWRAGELTLFHEKAKRRAESPSPRLSPIPSIHTDHLPTTKAHANTTEG